MAEQTVSELGQLGQRLGGVKRLGTPQQRAAAADAYWTLRLEQQFERAIADGITPAARKRLAKVLTSA